MIESVEELTETQSLDDIENLGWKLGILEWQDPCLVVGGTHNQLYQFYSIGYYYYSKETQVYTIVSKIDRVSFPAGQNVSINVPKANIKSITNIPRKSKK